MQAKTYSKIIILLIVSFSICHGDQADDLYRRYKDTIFSGDLSERYNRMWVTPEIRQILLQKAQAEYASSTPSQKDDAYSALIELGDKTTIESYMADYHSGKVAEVMPSDELLPYLIDDLYHGSTQVPPRAPGSDLLDVRSPMDKSTQTIYDILRLYPSFPPETRKWAEHSAWYFRYGQGPNNPANQMLRAWWEHNKEAVLAHKYGDANWLPAPIQEKDKFPSNPTAIAIGERAPGEPAADVPLTNDWGIPWPITIALLAFISVFVLVRLLTKKSR